MRARLKTSARPTDSRSERAAALAGADTGTADAEGGGAATGGEGREGECRTESPENAERLPAHSDKRPSMRKSRERMRDPRPSMRKKHTEHADTTTEHAKMPPEDSENSSEHLQKPPENAEKSPENLGEGGAMGVVWGGLGRASGGMGNCVPMAW